MCIFENDTVKSDCPMQDLKIQYRLLVHFTSLTVCSGEYLKKKKSSENEKKSSENDQSTGHFQSFYFFFFCPPNPKSEKNSRKSTNKKNLA